MALKPQFNMPDENKELILKVARAESRDVARGRVRIDSSIMQQFRLEFGAFFKF